MQLTSDPSDTLAMDKEASISSHIVLKHEPQKGGIGNWKGDVKQMLTTDGRR